MILAQAFAVGFCVRVGICLFIIPSPECPFKGQESKMSMCVCGVSARVREKGERDREDE